MTRSDDDKVRIDYAAPGRRRERLSVLSVLVVLLGVLVAGYGVLHAIQWFIMEHLVVW